jgi:hypothetical protein
VTSINAAITLDCLTLNDRSFVSAGPPSVFHELLGFPSRIVAAGPPAPYGHRNGQLHVYDSLGIVFSEHHYTYTIDGMTFVLWPEESHFDVRAPFDGQLTLGLLDVVGGLEEHRLPESGLPLRRFWAGSWDAKGQISIMVELKGRKLASGRRSKKRSIAWIYVGFQHDPWSKSFRPAMK